MHPAHGAFFEIHICWFQTWLLRIYIKQVRPLMPKIVELYTLSCTAYGMMIFTLHIIGPETEQVSIIWFSFGFVYVGLPHMDYI